MGVGVVRQDIGSLSGITVRFGNYAVRLSPELREQAIITAWMMVTFTVFRRDELLLYPLALYFAAAAIRDRSRFVPMALQGLVLFAFPTWWLLSVFWANDPFIVARSGVQLVLTMVICVHAASWLTLRQMMVSVFLASLLMALLSVEDIMAGGRSGVFPHKNALGTGMTILWMASLSISLDAQFPRWFRFVASLAGVLAAYLIVGTESATALVFFLGSIVALVAGAVFIGDASVMRLDRLSGLFLGLGLACALLSPIVGSIQMNLWEELLSALGKDTTLTGRTKLWEYAWAEIERHPLLGVGPKGFWNYSESPLVRLIYQLYYRRPTDLFTFHSSILEILVHLGLVGLIIATATVLWAVGHLVRSVIRRGGMPQMFFCTLTFSTLAKNVTESGFLDPFGLLHMLIWMSALRIAGTEGGLFKRPSGPGRGASERRDI